MPLLIATSLAGCAEPTYAAACASPPAPIRSISAVGEPPELTPVIHYRVSEQGAMTRGDEHLTPAAFEDILALSGEMAVMPIVLVAFDQNTACSNVDTLRQLLSESEICRAGQCLEGELPSGWHAMAGT